MAETVSPQPEPATDPASPGIPEWDKLGIPEDDEAEPEDAGESHDSDD